jgi:hypothetical protein
MPKSEAVTGITPDQFVDVTDMIHAANLSMTP